MGRCATVFERYVVALLLAIGLALVAASASAHFLLNLNVRILHVEHLADGLRVYLRTPMPYLVAGKLGPVGEDGLPRPAPFTSNAIENGQLTHYVDFSQISADPIGLGVLAEDGYVVATGDGQLSGAVEQVRSYRVGAQPDFAGQDGFSKEFGPRRLQWRPPIGHMQPALRTLEAD